MANAEQVHNTARLRKWHVFARIALIVGLLAAYGTSFVVASSLLTAVGFGIELVLFIHESRKPGRSDGDGSGN